MNKHVLAFLLIASLSSSVTAQSLPPGRTQETYVMANDRIVGMLELDTTQRKRLETIERRYQQDIDDVLANDTISVAAANERTDRIARARHQDIKAVLTPAQYERWSRLIADAEAP